MIQSDISQKKRAAALSVVSNTSLILLKFFAGFVSGSIGIIAEAVHSASDLLASIITFFSVSESSKPADKVHQFGHGKFEDFTSFIEGILIILAAFYIVYESLRKLIFSHTVFIDTKLGLWVMGFSVLVNIIVSYYLFSVAKKTDSAALYADAEHLRTDIYSSFAVFIGLLVVKITGNHIYDPIIAILVAIIIFNAGYKICFQAKKNLLDESLSDNDNSRIRAIVADFSIEGVCSLKKLRTRKAGLKKNIEITLGVQGEMTIKEGHELCDRIENALEAEMDGADTTIHLEPE